MAGYYICRWDTSRYVLGATNRDRRPVASPHLTHVRLICSASQTPQIDTRHAQCFHDSVIYIWHSWRESSPVHHQSSMSAHIEARTEESDVYILLSLICD